MSLFVLLMTPVLAFGQGASDFCENFIDQAFSEFGNNCANIEDQNACYGYGDVQATFFEDGQANLELEDLFQNPSERVSLIDPDEVLTLEDLEPAQFQRRNTIEDTEWGIAMMSVRNNLPQQLDANTAIYILFGGTRIENGVLPDDAFLLPEPVSISTTDATVFGSPQGLNYIVPSDQLETISGVRQFEADAQSPDGQWVRVFYTYERTYGERTTAWIQVADIDDSDAVSDLPVLGPDDFAPMQDLYLTSIFNDPSCQEVPPPGLLVQGPDEIETDFEVNNEQIRVTSTAFIEHISPRRMRVSTISGFSLLNPDTPDEIVIPAGFSKVLCLTPLQDLGIDNLENDREIDEDCPEGPPEPYFVAGLDGLPDNLLNYAYGLPEEVCASGIGGVVCTIQLPPPAEQRIRERCEAGVIPENVCERFGF
jgi:hypothetical protein